MFTTKTRKVLARTIGLSLFMLFCTVTGVRAQWTGSTDVYKTNTAGNVGIGTTSPTTKLTVTDGATPYTASTTDLFQLKRNTSNGTANAGVSILLGNNSNAFRIQYGGSSDRLSFLDGGNVETLSLLNGGNVGIGTTSPGSKLVVSAPDNANAQTLFRIQRGDGLVALTAGFALDSANNMFLGTSTNHPMLFTTNNTERMRIDTSGNIGIGKTNPTVALDVVGSINLTGTVNAKYQDVAEWVPSSEQLSAGTVVVLDSTKSNQVTSSSVSYDTRVAGVVSEQPGIALGEKSDGKALIATTGRVRVKVDATKSPIHIGDLLVTSDVPGVAMKSEPVNLGGVQFHRPGTLIGKALEPLEKGKGEILVLLSLQ